MAGLPAAVGGLILAALAAGDPPPATPAPAEPPSVELLLFLAEFGDDEGRFVDPTTVGDAAATDPDEAPGELQDEHPDNDDAKRDPPL